MTALSSVDWVWSQIVARAWGDEDFKRRLLSEPVATLAELEVVPDLGMAVEVVIGTEIKVEDLEGIRRYVLTDSPPGELIEEDLVGGAMAYCYSAVCGYCAACACRCYCRCLC